MSRANTAIFMTLMLMAMANGCAANAVRGWFVANRPTATGSYTSATSANSRGGANSVARLGTGYYELRFPLLGGVDGGNLQVTAMGPGAAYCKPVDWSQIGNDVVAHVVCFDAGVHADSGFVASYEASNPASPEHAYAWYVPPSAPSQSPSVPPVPGYSANVSGIYVPTGQVILSVASVSSLRLEHLTAVGPGPEHCSFTSRGISCFDPSGAHVDAGFSYIVGMGRVPPGKPHQTLAAFAKFDLPWPSVTVHTPTVQGSTFSATPITVTRTALGKYTVAVPDAARSVPRPMIVHVTGYDIRQPGGLPQYCKLEDWRAATSPDTTLLIDVACFRLEHGPATPADNGFRIGVLMIEPYTITPPRSSASRFRGPLTTHRAPP